MAELRNTGGRTSLGGGKKDGKFNSAVWSKSRMFSRRCHTGVANAEVDYS